MVEDWYALLGREVPQWARTLPAREFPDVKYWADAEKGYSLAVRNDLVSYVTLHSGRTPPFSHYRGPLPYGLQWPDTNVSIVQRLGEPSQKSRPTCAGMGIEVVYDALGLTIEFMSNEWEDTHNLPRTLTLFPGKLPLQPWTYPLGACICAVCARESTSKCGRCRVINYCSRECQVQHWKARHRLECRR